MLESAKVDIRKLQDLNDRINECFEALTQVRGSVHGLSHSSPAGGWPQQAVSYGVQDPRFANQDPRFPGLQAGAGLSHTAYGRPLGYSGFAGQPAQQIGYAPQQATFAPQGVGFGSNQGWGLIPIAGGLSHSPAEIGVSPMISNDPALAMRIAQTFPYAQQAIPPVTQIP